MSQSILFEITVRVLRVARCAILCRGLRAAKVLEHRLLVLPQLPRELNMSQMYGVVTHRVQDAPYLIYAYYLLT